MYSISFSVSSVFCDATYYQWRGVGNSMGRLLQVFHRLWKMYSNMKVTVFHLFFHRLKSFCHSSCQSGNIIHIFSICLPKKQLHTFDGVKAKRMRWRLWMESGPPETCGHRFVIQAFFVVNSHDKLAQFLFVCFSRSYNLCVSPWFDLGM